jgi:hypothetical protein
MSVITDCTSTEIVDLDSFEFDGEEMDQWLATLHTANKTDFFRAQLELSLINQIASTKNNDRLNLVAYSGKMELVGSSKAWKTLNELSEMEEDEEEMDVEEDEIFVEIGSRDILSYMQKMTAEMAYVSPNKISSVVKLQMSGYDANHNLLGSRAWVLVPSKKSA